MIVGLVYCTVAYFAVSFVCYHHVLAGVLDLFIFFVELISYYLFIPTQKTDKKPTTTIENKNIP